MQGEPRSNRWWDLGAVALVAAIALGLRYGTNILRSGPIFDERFIIVPIEDLIDRGWSVETAIDYTETKGPTFIWTYAALGRLLGGELNDLRLISVLAFIAGVVPLLLIAGRCGLRGPSTLMVAGFYVLLPHNAVLSQLLMSEPLFIFGALWLAWLFLWGSGGGGGGGSGGEGGGVGDRGHPVLGPVLFGVVLSLLLHLRVHAVALAAAASLVAIERDGRRAWPWIAACAAAGLSRLPLWLRWGGLVSPEYQSAHQLGLDLDAVTYLAAATIPLTAIFLWPALKRGQVQFPRGPLSSPGTQPGKLDLSPFFHGRRIIMACAGAGMVLALVARPTMGEKMQIIGIEVDRYMGLVWGAVGKLTSDPSLAGVLVGALAIAGLGGLGALAACAWRRAPSDVPAAVGRLQFWTLAAGCAMYGLTRSVVYDRYLLQWAVLLPVVWVGRLGRAALLAEGLLLLLMQCRFAWRMLVTLHPE